jgi:hypothetical protein
MLGGVRAESQTLLAPPSARSYAISIPEQPGPTTRTRLLLNGSGFLYSFEWRSSPLKAARPAQSGTIGSCS